MKLDEGMDSGPLLAQARVPIAERETGPELTRRLFDLGASLLADTLDGWASGSIRAMPQDESQATFTPLVKKEDGEIDWTDNAERIKRMVRAYEPWPGTFTYWDGKLLKILGATSTAGSASPGHVVGLNDGGIGIGTGDGVLAVDKLQIEGRRPSNAQDFVRGYPAFVGSALGPFNYLRTQHLALYTSSHAGDGRRYPRRARLTGKIVAVNSPMRAMLARMLNMSARRPKRSGAANAPISLVV